ncbi:MAG TPA: DUF3108 domain-containing protein [Rhizomicrobium sp.]
MRQVCLRPLVLAAALVATPAFAAAPGTLDVGYTIAFWSIPFGHTEYQAKFADGGYDAKSHFETSGVVSLFWNSKIDASANGKIGAHSITPALYDSYSTDHRSKLQRVKVTFDNNDPTTFAEPAYNTTKYPVTDAQKKGSVDPMTAITTILTGVKADAKNPCGTGVQVFDGRRRYDVLFSYVKDEPLKLDNGLYNGTAHECQVHYNEIAGYKQKIIAEGKKLPPMYADFIDVPGAGAPAGHYVIAAKLWAATGWGTVTAQLSELKVNGAPAKS